MRALRVDKLIIAGLSATLQRYLIDSTTAAEQFPMLDRYTRSIETLHAVAEKLKARLQNIFAEKVNIRVSETYGQIGSGALPVETLPSVALVLEPSEISAENTRCTVPKCYNPYHRQNQGRTFLAGSPHRL